MTAVVRRLSSRGERLTDTSDERDLRRNHSLNTAFDDGTEGELRGVVILDDRSILLWCPAAQLLPPRRGHDDASRVQVCRCADDDLGRAGREDIDFQALPVDGHFHD